MPPSRPRSPSRRRAALGIAALALAVAALAGVLAGVLVWRARQPEPMVVRELVRDLLAGPDAWEVVRSRADHPPRPGVLCPSADPALDGADRPALVLPPPAEVRFRTRPSDGPLVLDTAAGVDFGARDALPAGEVRVRFEVDVDGATVFRHEVRVGPGLPDSEWVRVGDEGGLALAPGARVALRTSLPDETEGSGPVVAAGFRRMVLERLERRERTRSSPERPNLVLVVQDTLRADRLSTYGYGRETSPRLDELAARGVVFEEAYATSSWTWPSTASLLTGLLPPEHGVTDDASPFLDQRWTTVAEALQRVGCTTAAWSGNPLVTPGKNFAQGFESFASRPSGFWKSDEIVPEVEAWIARRAGTRFFLYLHLVDVHEPHLPLPESAERFAPEPPEGWSARSFNRYSRELLHGKGHTARGDEVPERVLPESHRAWASDLYDACIHTGDHWLGRVLDALDEHGLRDETVVVFTSDHGEELLDHGFLNHGQSLYRELVRVPLVAAGPGLPAGGRVGVPVSNRHLAPTLALRGGAPWDDPRGVDLFADPPGSDLPGSDPPALFLSTTHGFWNGWHRTPIHGLRAGDWMLHWAPEAGAWAGDAAVGGDVRLYDLAQDPGETRDRAALRPLLAHEMRRALERRWHELAARAPRSALAAGEATLELLRNIGYLDAER